MALRLCRRRFVSTLIAGCVTLLPLAHAPAQQPPRSRLSYEYRLIEPQPVAAGERVEVVEFFWYGCPYCFQLQPPLESWLKRKPDDVELRRIPTIFRESWVPHARLYYTLEAVGEIGRLHQAVYRAFHEDREDLSTAETTAQWVGRHGIERSRWMVAYNSPEVDRKVEQSRVFTRSYAIKGTPSLVVDGRYLTSTGMTESVPEVIPILEDLIRLARQRRTEK